MPPDLVGTGTAAPTTGSRPVVQLYGAARSSRCPTGIQVSSPCSFARPGWRRTAAATAKLESDRRPVPQTTRARRRYEPTVPASRALATRTCDSTTPVRMARWREPDALFKGSTCDAAGRSRFPVLRGIQRCEGPIGRLRRRHVSPTPCRAPPPNATVAGSRVRRSPSIERQTTTTAAPAMRDDAPSAGTRAWGWHPLHRHWAERIVDAVRVRPGELILDIGAGNGALTAPLVEAGARVLAVELHPGRADQLRRRFAGAPVTVIQVDAADLRLPSRPFRVVANPPYGISTPLLRRLVGKGSRMSGADVVLQRALVNRWLNGNAPGAARWLRQYELGIGLRLPRKAFNPPPRVDSAVLVIRRRPQRV